MNLRFTLSELRLRWLALVFALLLAPSAFGQRITASITITNATTNGMTFTLNGDTRTFTNNVVNLASQVATNNDVLGNGSATNLLSAINQSTFLQVVAHAGGTNSFTLVGNSGLPMAVTMSTGLGTVSYSTQVVATLIGLTGPVSALPTAQARTNVASAIAGALGAVENTNSIPQGSKAASELVGTNGTQTIPGQKTFSNTSSVWNGLIYQLNDLANVFRGGYASNLVIDNSVFTNAVNQGAPFSSPGTGANSEQFGQGANALGNTSMAIGLNSEAAGFHGLAVGASSQASGDASVSLGYAAQAQSLNSTAIGQGSQAGTGGNNSTALGSQSSASAPGATSLGYLATSAFTNSTAVGASATTTAASQVMLGAPGISTVVNNDLTVKTNLSVGGNAVISGNTSFSGLSTNLTPMGTNNFPANSDIAFTRVSVSSLANGGNAAVPVGTNVYVAVSGPTGAFSIDGMANGRDGKMIMLVNQTSQQMTIKNESGTDPTAANRIRTLGSATDLVLTNAACTFIYDGSVSRWILISHNP